LYGQLGKYKNIAVKWVPGAVPTCFLYDKDDQLVAQTELIDSTLEDLKTLTAAAGLELAFPSYDKPKGPPDATGAFGELSYELYLAQNDFKNAREFAESLKKDGFGQGRLATIACDAQNNYIQELLRSNAVDSVWLGASDSENEGEWKWLDGPLADRVFWTGNSDGVVTQGLYSNWRPGEPNNVDVENCATFVEQAWNDVSCEGIFHPILVEFGEPTVMCPAESTETGDARVDL
jgi:myosin-crossreactive antigen